MTTLAQFLATGTGAATTTADLDGLKSGHDPRVVVVRGSHMRTKIALLDEVSAALQFPLDFGGNWDALADCLGDLSWLGGAEHVVLAMADAETVLADEPEQREILAAVLADREVRVLLGARDRAGLGRVRAAWTDAGLTVGEPA